MYNGIKDFSYITNIITNSKPLPLRIYIVGGQELFSHEKGNYI